MMMRKWFIFSWLGLLMSFSLVYANTSNLAPPQVVTDKFGSVQLVGQGRYTYWFWNVYDVALYAPNGQYDSTKPFSLTIEYLRDFTGKSLTDETIKQIKRQKNHPNDQVLEQWRQELYATFPDVSNGDWIVGVSDGNNAYFYNKQGQLLGEVKGCAFVHFFFNIWLGDNTVSQNMTRTLLGQ